MGSSSTSKRGTQTWKVTGSSNVYLLNNVSGSRLGSYYYWKITPQTTSYTWYIKGTYYNNIGNGQVRHGQAPSASSTDKLLCTISSNTTYSWTGILNWGFILEEYKDSYKYFNPLTIYRVNNIYGWG